MLSILQLQNISFSSNHINS